MFCSSHLKKEYMKFFHVSASHHQQQVRGEMYRSVKRLQMRDRQSANRGSEEAQ